MSSTSAMPQLAHTTSVSASLLLIIILPTKILIIPESIPKDIFVGGGGPKQNPTEQWTIHKQSTVKNEMLFLHRFSLRSCPCFARLHSHQKSNDDGEKIKPPMYTTN
jgi:hypothetical protein